MSITLILIIMTGIISFQAFNNPNMKGQLLFHPVAIKETGQWHRFITHGFIHADWGHLLINMYVLYLFGQFNESLFNYLFGPAFGGIVFIIFYISAIAAASLPSYFRNIDNRLYAALGASGATSALVFSYILFDPWQWFIFPPLPAILFGAAYLWYSSYMEKRGTDNIGHNIHFWGAIYGVVFILVSELLTKPEMITYFFYRLMEGPELPGFMQ
jgi:membrane associated rhomboid family serine protease